MQPLNKRGDPRTVGGSGHFALQQFSEPNVRFGSKTDIEVRLRNVRFTPKSGH
jgi:hypothetical protein